MSDDLIDGDTLAVPDLLPTDSYVIADRLPGEPLFDAARLPRCPHCGGLYVPLDDGDGMTTSHGVVEGVPACVGAPMPPAPVVPVRVTRAKRAAAAKSREQQIEAAAQIIYEKALENSTNFKASVWRTAMDRAGVPPEIRRHAVVHAIRQGYIEAINLLAGFEFGDEHVLEQYDRRDTRWRSLVYVPKRRTRRRPTTNGPTP